MNVFTTKIFAAIYALVISVTHLLAVEGVECVAHRGFISGGHENTIESIRAAWEAGADRVEVDVRILADSTLVLFHDKMVGDVEVSGLAYKQLQALTPDYHVPTLNEVLDIFPDRQVWLLDLKSCTPLFTDLLLEIINRPSLKSNLIFQSRYIPLLNELSRRLDNPRLFYVTSLSRGRLMNQPPDPAVLAKIMKGSNITGISAKGRQFINREYVAVFRNAGLSFYVWTINSKERISFYKSLGVDGVITDFPDLW